ncbi:hypothetical protein HUG15_19635 [Salicibibacter cibarius]|uniref:Uncharacterized protein n=1 Tax=Salicibibacter cibarius TaxID=2743000 RepID=A0A7T6Z648_9BACI|nr:hypothetical protein [Salicibibacter cibarius]QQK77575.1 hypothetical protein HUG15_19635 [Salicibibacter cibarius]
MKTLLHMYTGIWKELREDIGVLINTTSMKLRTLRIKLIMNNIVYLMAFTLFGLSVVYFIVRSIIHVNPSFLIPVGIALCLLTGFSLLRLFHYPKARTEVLESIEEKNRI